MRVIRAGVAGAAMLEEVQCGSLVHEGSAVAQMSSSKRVGGRARGVLSMCSISSGVEGWKGSCMC